ncbi:MAG: CDP-6-deoxy-delta-3,4-glucoseen reductase [Pseudomonadota bacterium]|nr:CDP-6-deoxy-delta-3,4-glucoseen reductase [Pseudomonadota bacterium]
MGRSVILEPGQVSFQVEPGETVLEAALRQGVALPYGCRNGTCGTCRARLISGSVGYEDGRPSALSAADHDAGEVLLCLARPESDLKIRARVLPAGDVRPHRFPVRVVSLSRVTDDVMIVRLRPPSAQPFRYLPGQFVDVLLKDGRRRSYSLATAPGRGEELELHVRRVSGGAFSEYVFSQMQEKALLRLEGPLGGFFWQEGVERPVLLVGGGTGIAPLKAMIEHAVDQNFSLPMHLYWGVRAGRDLYLGDRLRDLADQHANFLFTPVFSAAEPNDDVNTRRGWVHEAVIADYPDLADYQVYTSGPPAMIDAAEAAFLARGLPRDQLLFDSFEWSVD